jgi:type IV fimbrial biogenesis protein FimT
MCRDEGFTLVELLVVAALAALLCLLAMRAWGRVAVEANAGVVRSELAADLALSMTRSIAQSNRLLFCPSHDGLGCADSYDWSRGWISFTEPGADRQRTGASRTVAVHGPIDERVRLLSSSGRRSILFQFGGTSIGSNLTFTLCDRRSTRAIDTLVLGNAGKLRREAATGPGADLICAAAPGQE